MYILIWTVSLGEGLINTKELLNMSINNILSKLKIIEFPAFVFVNTYQTSNKNWYIFLKIYSHQIILHRIGLM